MCPLSPWSANASERVSPNPSPFPKLRPKDEECGGGAYQLVVGVLWRFAPGTGYAIGSAFVVGRLGFAGSLGIDVLVVN